MTSLSWNICPNEVVWLIFKKLDDASLLICLRVNEQWKAVAYSVLTQRHGNLKHAVKNILPDVGLLYSNRTHLNLKDTYVTSLLWYNVCNSTINFYGSCGSKVIYVTTYKGIERTLIATNKRLKIYSCLIPTCVITNCLIVVDEDGVSYYDMQENRFRHRLNVNCLTYDENDYFVVTTNSHPTHKIILSIFAKRSNKPVSFDKAAFYSSVIVYRFIDERCYFFNNDGCLFSIKMNEHRTNVILTPYTRLYGVVDYIVAMHVTRENELYILANGAIVLPGNTMPENSFRKWRICAYTSNCAVWTPFCMAFEWGLVIKDDPANELRVQYDDRLKCFHIICPGAVCACDHGIILLIGCSDGKVNMFIKSKLMKHNLIPDRTINVYDYYTGPYHSIHRDIRQIKVYETMRSHILCINTDSVTVKLLVENLELVNSDTQTENVDELCLSIIHMLNIEM